MNNLSEVNRVSIRAVLARDGDDVNEALAQAGITNPVAIRVLPVEDADPTGGLLGDGITPNLVGILEEHEADDTGPAPVHTARHEMQAAEPRTTMLPAEHGIQPFAPVRS